MSTATHVSEQPAIASDELPELSIDCWPLRDQPFLSFTMLLVTAASLAGLTWLSGVWWVGLLGVLGAAWTSWRVWMPLRTTLSIQGVTQQGPFWQIHQSWLAFPAWQERRRGVLLLRRNDQTGLSQIQGLYIPWGQHREEMLRVISFNLGPPNWWPTMRAELTVARSEEDSSSTGPTEVEETNSGDTT